VKSNPRRSLRAGRQTGATLIFALLFLLVIMLTGIAVMNNSGTQFKLAANAQFESLALNKAEAAVATAEDWLSTDKNYSLGGFTTYSAALTPHLHPIGRVVNLSAPNNNYLTLDWTSNALAVDGDTSQRYMIELLSKNLRLQVSNQGSTGRATAGCNQVNIFRISARGESARNAVKVVQSIYSVKSC
jgi:Tfp pilus assembly protein PilX